MEKNIKNIKQQFKEQITNRFVYHYINERRKHDDNFKSLSLEKVKVLKKVLPTIFKEIIGKMYFDVNNEKQFIDGINEELGFQLPDCLINYNTSKLKMQLFAAFFPYGK